MIGDFEMRPHQLFILGGSLLILAMISAAGCRNKDAGPPKSFVRPAFKFDYPAGWAVDDKDKDYDPDHMFSIDASTGAMIMFVIFEPGIEPATALAKMVTQQEKQLPRAAKADFSRWGKFDGVGTELRGKLLSVSPTTIRIFAFQMAGKTFVITELIPDDEKAALDSGFRMIQDSFEVIG